MQHLPHKYKSTKGRQRLLKQPAHGRLIVNSSTFGWVAPTGTEILSILDDARNSWITVRIRKHFRASCFVVLRIVVDKRNALRVVVVARLLTIGTAGLCVDY